MSLLDWLSSRISEAPDVDADLALQGGESDDSSSLLETLKQKKK